jgi:hypothetical protein
MRVVGLPEGTAGPMLLTVKMKNGRELTESPANAKDYILGKPMSGDELKAKFMAQVDFSQTVSRKDAEKLVELVEKLEDVDDVSKILALAVKR